MRVETHDGAFQMVNSLVLALTGLCLAAAAGCQNPVLSQQTVLDTGPSPLPAESSSGPLGKLERSLVFAPNRFPDGNWHPAGLDFEDAWFTAADGTRLHGWYVPRPQPRAVVLFCHGNAGNVALWADVLRLLHDRMGVAALVFDYRGYGRSEGTPSEAGVLADARAARTWLASRAGIAGKPDRADGPLAGRGRGRRSGRRRRPRPGARKHLHLDARGGPRGCCPGCPCGR